MTCQRCGGQHTEANCRRVIVFQSYAFSPPYICMCCGAPVPPAHWMTNHTCEVCDWGACEHAPESWHPLPSWRETTDGTEAFELYVEYVEAIPAQAMYGR